MISASPATSPCRNSQAVRNVPASRVVPRPVPPEQAADPRDYELNQLRRRYSPREVIQEDGSTVLAFKLVPSDPEFPFELEALHCELTVPPSYPDRDIEGPPRLRVKNADMPRGISINVERGWDDIVKERKGVMLGQLVRALDTALEALLSQKKVDTVTLVGVKDSRHEVKAAPYESSSQVANVETEQTANTEVEVLKPQLPQLPRESFSRAQIQEAKAKRAQETYQLECRMKRVPGYRREADGVVYTIPIELRDRPSVPAGVRDVKTVHLIVPLLYPLQPVRVQLVEARDDNLAEKVEDLFHEKAKELTRFPLVVKTNYLQNKLGILASEVLEKEENDRREWEKALAALKDEDTNDGKKEVARSEERKIGALGDDRTHIYKIQPPPEFAFGYRSPESSEDEEDMNNDWDEDEDGGARVGELAQPLPSSYKEDLSAERGTSISFPGIDLKNIEVLQLETLNISVKCERCKTVNNVTELKNATEKSTACTKCSRELTVRFRRQFLHEHNNRAGFLDLVGCSAIDLLPSIFTPTCASCSTVCPGLTCAKGNAMTNVCRSCHARFTLTLPALHKFQVLTAPLPSTTTTARLPTQGNIQARAGEPLPNRGCCQHYRRSFRWFRFSCCSRVHPCDACHDEASDHVHEWAERMICGHCAREQRYSPTNCQFCGRRVVAYGNKGSGFWEGGKGTRERGFMRRGEEKKFRRVGGGEERDMQQRKRIGD